MKIVCLCGSTRLYKQYYQVNREQTLLGNIVLSCGVFHHYEGIKNTPQEEELLTQLHLRKIDLADEIIFITLNGRTGVSTEIERKYAVLIQKGIIFINFVDSGGETVLESVTRRNDTRTETFFDENNTICKKHIRRMSYLCPKKNS